MTPGSNWHIYGKRKNLKFYQFNSHILDSCLHTSTTCNDLELWLLAEAFPSDVDGHVYQHVFVPIAMILYM